MKEVIRNEYQKIIKNHSIILKKFEIFIRTRGLNVKHYKRQEKDISILKQKVGV